MSSNPVAVTQTSDIAHVLSKEFFDIQTTTGFRFTLKRVYDMIRTHNHTFLSQATDEVFLTKACYIRFLFYFDLFIKETFTNESN